MAVAIPIGGVYDYFAGPAAAAPRGSVVKVPFGKRHVFGVILGAGTGGFELSKLREVQGLSDLPPISASFIAFLESFAGWTMTPIGAVMKMVLCQPAALVHQPKTKYFSLSKKMPEDERVTDTRKKVINFLQRYPGQIAGTISENCDVSFAVIRGMVMRGFLEIEFRSSDQPPEIPSAINKAVALDRDQKVAADELIDAIEGGFKTYLLDGVTGSGKTEVYFSAVEAAISAGKQVLILLPEIALSAAWRKRFEERFGCSPVEWHSDISSAKKRKIWRFVLLGVIPVVVGARSALFLPFNNLGLIIVDEEHESAFKQEDKVIYQARDMAVLRGQHESVPVILTSATPSLESWVNAGKTGLQARYRYLALKKRFKGASMPKMKTIDLRKTPPENGCWISPPLVDEIAIRLSRGEQSLLFLNRRGYAPLTICSACGNKVTCPNCDAWMVAHRISGCMLCHYCGYSSQITNKCSVCGTTDQMQSCGPGVERLAEEVLQRFPTANFAVLSSDTVSTSKTAEIFLKSVIKGEVDIIIGTQMAAKGHHFPHLTLVGVIDADLGLSGGDLRASERTFQMLTQVAGRAGRELLSGEAFLQTFEPDNPVLTALISGDRDNFLREEAAARKSASVPPFGQFAALILSSDSQEHLKKSIQQFAIARPEFNGVEIFGPTIAPIAFLKGKHRARALIKTKKTIDIQRVLRLWVDTVKLKGQVRVTIDIDPYNFL